MTVETMNEPDGVPPDDLNEPYTVGVAVDAVESTDDLRPSALSVPTVGQDHNRAVSGSEDPPPSTAALATRTAIANGNWLGWMSCPSATGGCSLRRCSRLMAEAAATDDLAPVEQALREWRVAAKICLDPELARHLSGPRVANGPRAPRPDV